MNIKASNEKKSVTCRWCHEPRRNLCHFVRPVLLPSRSPAGCHGTLVANHRLTILVPSFAEHIRSWNYLCLDFPEFRFFSAVHLTVYHQNIRETPNVACLDLRRYARTHAPIVSAQDELINVELRGLRWNPYRGLILLTVFTPRLCILLQADALLQDLGKVVLLYRFLWKVKRAAESDQFLQRQKLVMHLPQDLDWAPLLKVYSRNKGEPNRMTCVIQPNHVNVAS